MKKYRERIKAEETPEQKAARLKEIREYKRLMRSLETPEETQARKAKEREYDRRSRLKKKAARNSNPEMP